MVGCKKTSSIFEKNHRYEIVLQKTYELTIMIYANVDWALCVDDMRSTRGWCNFLGKSLVSWSLVKHRVVSRSFIEVECRSLALTIIEILCLK